MARPILVSSLRFLVVWIIRGYQVLVSPFLGRNCRFMPTCSQYGIEAVERFGVCRGLWLTACRLVKCGPWHPGGYDPVPLRDGERQMRT